MLRALLEKWAGLEPERCHATTAGMFDIRCRAQEVIAVVGNLTSARPLGGPWLLAAIVEAIDARGYSPWHLSRDEDGFAADVTRYPSGYAVTVYGPDKCPTAVEALLTAYLSALEAES